MSGYRNSIKPAAVLVTVTAVLVGMTWAIVENATHRVLREDAIVTAETWVSYLGEHVTELRKIATNMAPSRDALKSFETGHRVAKVFRHKIFDADGQLRFDSDSQLGGAADTQDLQAHNPAAWRAIQGGRPYIVQTDIRRPGRPARVTEA